MDKYFISNLGGVLLCLLEIPVLSLKPGFHIMKPISQYFNILSENVYLLSENIFAFIDLNISYLFVFFVIV